MSQNTYRISTPLVWPMEWPRTTSVAGFRSERRSEHFVRDDADESLSETDAS